jgi:hypothetical protein
MAPKRRSSASERRQYIPEDKALAISNRGIIEARGWFSSFISSVASFVKAIAPIVKIVTEIVQLWTDLFSYSWQFQPPSVAGEVYVKAPSVVVAGDPYANSPDRHFYFTPKQAVVNPDPVPYCPPGRHCMIP